MKASPSEPRALSGISNSRSGRADEPLSARSLRCRVLALIGLLGVLASVEASAQAPIVFSQHLEPTADDLALAPRFATDFGDAVAISGSTAMVGLPGYGEGLGRVGVYARTEEGWLRTATISNPEPEQLEFGRAIALDDCNAVIDARTAAYFFRKHGEQWRLVAAFARSDPEGTLGSAVEYSNGFLARGIQTFEVGSEGQIDRPGIVHLYRHHEDDVRLVARLCASDRAPADLLGVSLAMEPRVLVAGAPGLNAAYVFVDDGQRWVQRQKLVSSDGGGAFGASVAIRDGTILVGAPGVDLPDPPSDDPTVGPGIEGNAYVFLPHEGTWFETQRLNDDGRVFQLFGTLVALSDELAAVVTPFDVPRTSSRSAVIAFDRVGAELTSRREVFSTGFQGDRVVDIDLSDRRLVIGVQESPQEAFPRALVLEFGAAGAGADDSLAAAPGNDGIGGGQDGDGDGGGSIDALLAMLLAQLALARALRQRIRPKE